MCDCSPELPEKLGVRWLSSPPPSLDERRRLAMPQHPVCSETDLAESVRATLCQSGFPPIFWALMSVALISIAPLVVMPFIPAADTKMRGAAQPLLLCFATGGMLGDVFLHILPETLSSSHDHHDHHGHGHSHSDEHDHGGHSHSIADSAGSLAVLGGFIAFFLVEKIVRHFNKNSSGGCSHEHGLGGLGTAEAPAAAATPAKGGRRARSPARGASKAGSTPPARKHPSAKKEAAKEEAPVEAGSADDGRVVGGYLNLAADAAHNFTDGLLLGAAFLPMVGGPAATWKRGVATTLAVLVHEVPHEVGDVAVLMQAGWGKWAAIRTQLLTALGAALGAVVGVATGETKAHLLLNFTAGGFIYVATVDVLPQLLRECSVWQTVKEVLAMCGGISLMLVVMAFE